MGLTFESSDKAASYGKRPHITKGFYRGSLMEVKPRADKEGNAWIGKWGNEQAILLFLVNNQDGSNVMYKDENGEEQPVKLPMVINTSYKDEKTGEKRTAFTLNSASTKTFKALGWEGPPAPLKTDDFIGREVELLIEDYMVEVDGGENYKASRIGKVEALEGDNSPSPSAKTAVAQHEANKPKTVKKTITAEEATKAQESIDKEVIAEDLEETEETKEDPHAEKKAGLKKALDEGLITKEGYEAAMKQLEGSQ